MEFILNNTKITTNANPAMTLVDFIRENNNLKGTKIVCREGDCGACTVMVGELNGTCDNVKYQTITSCISPLANAQGKHIVTVEGLNISNKLNNIQQEIKDNYASQCGFCTPGFVVAMVNYCLSDKTHTLQQMLDAISGNICRCTGYVAIINAAKKIVQDSHNNGKKFTLEQLIEKNFIPEYFLMISDKLKSIKTNRQTQKEEIVAGGTDLYVQQADNLAKKETLRFVVLENKENIEFDNNQCSIAATCTVTDLFENKLLQQKIENWQQYLRLLSSQAIRNMATIAGNFVNASPIGDMSIILLALNANLELFDGVSTREVLLKNFFIDYKKVNLNANEIINKITFDLPTDTGFFNFEKVSKRKHLDIATVNTAIYLEFEKNIISSCRLSIGGVAAIPKYLSKTSKFLVGKAILDDTIKQAIAIMHTEISPISDVRGTDDYKRLLAENLLKAHFAMLNSKSKEIIQKNLQK
ncbi:MAG TPA: 2Fe-2S iron-sulfur cluster binding domain-containing protein [Oceanospirillales bacterium]|nr:2Fe-2S iron-sulfur cluster binding domain-containing protein [Oceanospirillales bacterium]